MFELLVNVLDSPLRVDITVITDLLLKARIEITAKRAIGTTDDGTKDWTMLEELFPVGVLPSGDRGVHIVSLVDEMDKTGRDWVRYILRRTKTKTVGLPTEEVEITARYPRFYGPDQHKFGICNRNLTGKAVLVVKSGHSVERSMRLRIPLSDKIRA